MNEIEAWLNEINRLRKNVSQAMSAVNEASKLGPMSSEYIHSKVFWANEAREFDRFASTRLCKAVDALQILFNELSAMSLSEVGPQARQALERAGQAVQEDTF